MGNVSFSQWPSVAQPLILMIDLQKNSFLVAFRIIQIKMKRYIKLAILYIKKGIPKFSALVASVIIDNQHKTIANFVLVALFFSSSDIQGLSFPSSTTTTKKC